MFYLLIQHCSCLQVYGLLQRVQHKFNTWLLGEAVAVQETPHKTLEEAEGVQEGF
jgi:hypothetical protein